MKRRSLYIFLTICATLLCLRTAQAQADLDTDNDGLTDSQENNIYYTDPTLPDTDGDGFSDANEITNGYSPRFSDNKKMTEVDSDKDYLPDAWELSLGTGLMNPDSDGDLYLDGTEVRAGFDPLNQERVQKEKLISVSLAKQSLTYSFDGRTLETFPISGGVAGLPTPRGDFAVIKKYPLKNYGGAGYYYPNTKWNLHFTTINYNYYIHGAYWHNDFGKPKSHGCVNVSYSNMERLYDWAQVGTKIKIQ